MAPPTAPPPAETFPITGVAAPGMASFDRIIPDLMKKWGIPGGAVAVVKDGRLVLARGYGYADQAKQSVQPDALFRIASVSKPLTAVAILKLWRRAASISMPRLSCFATTFHLHRVPPPIHGFMT